MDNENYCTVKELSERFDLKQVCGNEESLKRKLLVPNTNRPGLELTGFFDHAEPKRVVIIGNKEVSYLRNLDEKQQDQRFDFITDAETPLVLVTSDRELPQSLKKVADRKNFPVFTTPLPSSEIMVDIVTFLVERLAPRHNVHGVLMDVFGMGVLIIGESGMGKSEVALELILRGHALIADDRVDITRIRNSIHGTAPELLKGMLEIRGIGIIDVCQMFGVRSFLEQEHIDFVVEFQKWDDHAHYRRAGIEEQSYYETLDVKIPKLVFPVKEGRNLAVLVETAVGDFILKQRGVNSSRLFDQRVMDFIMKQNKERQHD